MKLTSCIALIGMILAGPAGAATLPACTSSQLGGYRPDNAIIKAHRAFKLPTLSYPGDTQLRDGWGLDLTLRVDASGHIVCQQLQQDSDSSPATLNPQRRTLLADLSSWRYTPFVHDHRTVATIVTEHITEQKLPAEHQSLPDVPLKDVHIALTRSTCYGFCPDYRVDVYGNGRVVYDGKRFVDIPGKHSWQIPANDVARLVHLARTLDIWSMQPSYFAHVTDMPGYSLTLTFGNKTHHINDYAGQMVGMPKAVTRFEDAVDHLSRADQWVHLSSFAVDRLHAEGFKFHSRAGADLLARAITDAFSHDDATMVRLIQSGAPVHGSTTAFGMWQNMPPRPIPLVRRAVIIPRSLPLVNALIDAGALQTNGHPDQDKIDKAFQAAIFGGQLPLVKRLWAVHGTQPHPSLTYVERSRHSGVTKRLPVTLQLSRGYDTDKPWDGLAIAQWLLAKGCDINARTLSGRTLLQVAADAGDPAFVRYLLAHGANASAPAEDGKPALAYANNGETAMVLLKAGTDLSRMPDKGGELLHDARHYHWPKVAAWLTAHHVKPSKQGSSGN
ncbi:MAG TPA: DUF6438 domain-containing protein [Rhodanobacteraceae bacterium]